MESLSIPLWHRTSQLIINCEVGRLGTRGYVDGLLAGEVIGLPPVLNFGSPELQAKVVPEVLDGKKFICLAVSPKVIIHFTFYSSPSYHTISLFLDTLIGPFPPSRNFSTFRTDVVFFFIDG